MRKLMLACLMGFMMCVSTSACLGPAKSVYYWVPPPASVQHYNPTHRHIGKVNVKQSKLYPRHYYVKPKPKK